MAGRPQQRISAVLPARTEGTNYHLHIAFELSNTMLENPLDADEIEMVLTEISELADLLEECSEDPEADEEQLEAALETAKEIRAAASKLHFDPEVIGFDEASLITRMLQVSTSDPEETDQTKLRVLNGAAAKLDRVRTDPEILEARREEYQQLMADEAAERGFAVQHVMADPGPVPVPGFSYTVGLDDADHPELVMVNVAFPSAQLILERLAEQIVAGEPLEDQQLLSLDLGGDIFEFMVRECPEAVAANLFLAADDVAAYQICWPDDAGLFPGQAGADPESAMLQLLPDPEE